MDDSVALPEVTGLVLIGAPVLGILLYLWMSVALAALFRKLGEPGWKAWVPILNTVTLLNLGGYSALWVITLFLPVVGFVGVVVTYLAAHAINLRFGRGGGFTALAVLLPPVWAGILGFGSDEPYDGPSGAEPEPFVPSRPPVTWGGPPSSVTDAASAPESREQVVPEPFVTGDAALVAAMFDTSVPPISIPAPAPAPTPAPEATPSVPAPAPAAEPVFLAPASVPDTEPVLGAGAALSSPAPEAAPAPAYARPAEPIPVAFDAPAAAVPPAMFTRPAPPAFSDDDDDIIDGATVITRRGPVVEVSDDDENDVTVISARRAKPWVLETEEGQRVELSKPVALLGRNPSRTRTHPDAQLVTLADDGKTVSKTHARLELVDGTWLITDLHSTNGIVLRGADGLEHELEAGASAAVTEEVLLGELLVWLSLERSAW